MSSKDQKKYVIKVADNAFNKDTQAKRIASKAKPYSSKLAEASKLAEELDRYDDFGILKIELDAYQQKEHEYGIPRGQIHILDNSRYVILPNQQKAISSFLRELRGFGMLADVVGSGKTFEACAVLSELSVRGKINSLLLVVPEQTYDAWKEVLEVKFGMGKDVLQEAINPLFDDISEIISGDSILRKPNRPVIVKTEDFVKWPEGSLENVLFDAVVVDEAHHLCLEEGEYAKALKLLSMLMVTKKKANSTYCLLLSATPHSGNLEKMFRLWYFIRCKGGTPKDFDDKDDQYRTAEYLQEKEFYLKSVCNGATTVAEFIAISKQHELEGVGVYVPKFKAAYLAYVKTKLEGKDYEKLTEAERRILREEYLDKNPSIKSEVLKKVANAYHNKVMRSIMIRQPNRVPRTREVENFYFYPTVKTLPEVGSFDIDGHKITVKLQKLDDKEGVEYQGRKLSLPEFASEIGHDQARTFSEIIIPKILGKFNSFTDKKVFAKDNSLSYYWAQLQETKVSPDTDKFIIASDYKGDIFPYKFRKLVELLEQYKSERIIIFFDYDLNQDDTNSLQWIKVKKQLEEKYPDIYKRVVYAASESKVDFIGNTKTQVIKNFNKSKDAILIVGDSAFTEGVNLQEGRIIINFQVTPDPLAMDQRIGRVFRLGQSRDVKIISLAAMNELEGYSLAYFNRIALLNNTTGDATIIAGSNNEHMVAVRCPACERVYLYSSAEYADLKNKGKLRCDADEKCRVDNPKGTEMEEINVYEFKCDKCGATLSRKEGEGYKCFAINNSSRGKLNNLGKPGNRTYYCSKYCSILHCRRFIDTELGKNCLIIQKYKDSNVVPSYAACKVLCSKCPELGKNCPEKCTMIHPTMEESIQQCIDCDSPPNLTSECRPKPHKLEFDEKWRAKCPSCGGTLRPVVSRTFAAYIRAAFSFSADNGSSFCNNFLREAKKTDDLRVVLESDNAPEEL